MKKKQLGATLVAKDTVEFCVWSSRAQNIQIKIHSHADKGLVSMKRDQEGYFRARVKGIGAGATYSYVLDGEKERPDPASRYQPEGVHGPSQVIDPSAYRWKDSEWKSPSIKDFIIYELHIGTFTAEGTFDAAIEKLGYLKSLGITCVEVMPICQFPGKRNWGYDGVDLYAVQNSYGGPEGFRRFVDACHRKGLAVCLDVVYNHFGPEGNYLHDYGAYFTGKYHTPWGDAVNYDDHESLHVRHFVVQNALYWLREFHVDALRLDAIHGIYDMGPVHVLSEMATEAKKLSKKLKRSFYVTAESDLNDWKIVGSKKKGGYELDSQWADDFHHALHVTVTGERDGYYEDYKGLTEVVKALRNGFVYDGNYSKFRKKEHGSSSKGITGEKFIFCMQNHDQIGNRPQGDRLGRNISFEIQKVAPSVLLLAPYLPLLYMGQEYGETAPFQYFVDHGDEHLIQAVREGRKAEFQAFGYDEYPDPASEKVFKESKLDWKLVEKRNHQRILYLYQDLIALRKKMGILSKVSRAKMKVHHREGQKWFALEYRLPGSKRMGAIFNFDSDNLNIKLPFRCKKMTVKIHTEAPRYGGRLENVPKSLSGDVDILPQCAIIGELQ